MRIDTKAAEEAASLLAIQTGSVSVCPEGHAAKRHPEVLNRPHCHGVGHLLVELRRALARFKPVLCQDLRSVEIDRRIGAGRGWVDVHYLKVFPTRPGL